MDLSRKRHVNVCWHNKFEALLFTPNGCSTKLPAGSADRFHAKQDKP
jgi:hypothetical protein